MNENDIINDAEGNAEEIESKPLRLRTDEAIKMLFSAEKQALIRFINSALGESYDLDTTEYVELKTEFILQKSASHDMEPETEEEHFDPERIFADMIFTLNGVTYHIEFQTKSDKTIVIRILGYGAAHSLSELKNKSGQEEVVFELPVPVLIQIDKDDSLTDKIPAQIKLSGRDEKIAFEITVVRLWTYDVDDLIAREFYLLLPFLLMRHRKKHYTSNDIKAFIADINKIEAAIAKLYANKQIYSYLGMGLYTVINSIVKYISIKYFDNNADLSKELKIMDEARVLFAHEIEAKGKAEGIAEGEVNGVAIATQTVKLLLLKKTPQEISNELKISLSKVMNILEKTGLLEYKQ